MRIDADEVNRIATLAHLQLKPEESEAMAEELSAILDYIAQLQDIRLPETLAAAAPEPSGPHLREDEVRPSLPVSAVAANAPAFAGGFFVVPRIIGGE